MGLYDLSDRLSYHQACVILGCSKSTFFRLVSQGEIPAYGASGRGRFFLMSDCKAYLERKRTGRKKMGTI